MTQPWIDKDHYHIKPPGKVSRPSEKHLQAFAILSLVGGIFIGILAWLTWRVWTIMGAPIYETALTAIVMAAWNMVVWLVIVMPKEAE